MIEALAHAAFDDVGERDHSKNLAVLTHQQWRSTTAGNLRYRVFDFRWHLLPTLEAMPRDGVLCPFADFQSVEIHARHSRLRRERNKVGAVLRKLAPANSILFLGQHDNGAPFGRLVSERRKLRGTRQVLLRDTRGWNKCRRRSIAERDGSGLVEKQHVNVAGRFDGASGHGDDIALDQTVHSGNTDGGEQASDRGRNEANQQRYQDKDILWGSRIDSERLQRHYRQQKDSGQTCKENIERNFVRRFLPSRSFHQLDHAIKEGFARIR